MLRGAAVRSMRTVETWESTRNSETLVTRRYLSGKFSFKITIAIILLLPLYPATSFCPRRRANKEEVNTILKSYQGGNCDFRYVTPCSLDIYRVFILLIKRPEHLIGRHCVISRQIESRSFGDH
jgi:hypothetical protein